MAEPRSIAEVLTAQRQLEGAGFPVRRPFPSQRAEQLDPFLLLDEMGPSVHGPGEAQGAPDHPHRGFETVTYMLAGEMVHEDSAGHRGRIGPGDVQWMTAGAGVVHSELPGDEVRRLGGRQHGFQLWVNLPRKDKRLAPRYQEIPAARIPEATTADGKVRVRVIAGESLGERAVIDTRTPIAFLHVKLRPGGKLLQPLPRSYSAFAYVFGGQVRCAPGRTAALDGHCVVFRQDGDAVELSVADDAPSGGELLLIAGEPLNEPLARYGPFVMNSREEIVQAFEDYRAGRLGRIQR